jgi:hypothetical protein
MGIAQTIALNWRAITAFLMAAVQLATAIGWLPVGSEETANTLIATAGGVIAVIAGGSYVQNIADRKALTASAGAVQQSAATVQAVAEAAPSASLAGGATMARGAAERMAALAGKQPQ